MKGYAASPSDTALDMPLNVGRYIEKDIMQCDRIAVIDASGADDAISYREFNQRVNFMAQHLLNRGVRPGDRVMVMLTNSVELHLCYFACFKIGVIMQPLNFFISSEEILYASMQCRPSLLITNDQLFSKMATIVKNMEWITAYFIVGTTPVEGTQSFSKLISPTPVGEFPAVAAGDFGQLFFVFTRQQTQFYGRGVLLSHWVMERHSKPYELLHLSQQDVVAGILHPYNALTRAVFKAGATYVLIREFSGDKFLDHCDRYGISFLGATPAMFKEIIAAARNRACVPLSLRACFCAGNLLDNDVWKEFEDLFQTRVYGGIGCKELGIFSLEPYGSPARYGSIGKVLPYMDYKIVSRDVESAAKAQSKGVLAIKSDSLISHYWIDGSASPLNHDNGWFSTGYEVLSDEEGYLYLTGKVFDHSITGSKRYYNIQ